MRGHLRQRGEAWELRAYAGRDPSSRAPKYVTRTFRGGKREAEEALARLVAEVSSGQVATTTSTVGELLDQWFEFAKDDLSPSTARGYEGIIRTYLRPAIGDVRLSRLRPATIDRLYKELRDHGGHGGVPLAPATVRQAHAVLRRALQQAVRWGQIPTNPAALASPPRASTPRLTPPTPEQLLSLLDEAREWDPDLECLLLTAATTGARRGELCALRWTDLDLEAGTMLIARSIAETGHGILEKDTKTHAARRIALDVGTRSALEVQRDRLVERSASCGTSLPSDAFVFPANVEGTRPRSPDDVTKDFVRLRTRLGFGAVRLHDLRHFAATRMLAAGVPVRTVSGRLGHANASTTLGVYAHFLEASDREAAEKLGALLPR